MTWQYCDVEVMLDLMWHDWLSNIGFASNSSHIFFFFSHFLVWVFLHKWCPKVGSLVQNHLQVNKNGTVTLFRKCYYGLKTWFVQQVNEDLKRSIQWFKLTKHLLRRPWILSEFQPLDRPSNTIYDEILWREVKKKRRRYVNWVRCKPYIWNLILPYKIWCNTRVPVCILFWPKRLIFMKF